MEDATQTFALADSLAYGPLNGIRIINVLCMVRGRLFFRFSPIF